MGASVGLTMLNLWSGSQQRSKASRAQRAAMRSDMQGYWETYQKWGQEAATSHEQSVTSLKARMAAGGVKAGSEQWETNIAGLTSEYEAELEGFKTGVTGSALAEWVKMQQPQQQQQSIDMNEAFRDRLSGATPLDMSEYLTQEFGALDLTPEAPSARKAAATTARQEAAGTAPTASPTGTPWW